MPRTQVPEEGQRVQNINELKDLKPRPEAVIRTEGAASRNDGLSNLYWWDPNGVATNANGTTIISSNVSGYTSGDPDEGVWRRMFKPSSEIESQIEKSAGNQGAVQYSDGSGGFLGDANYLYVDDSNGNVGIGTNNPKNTLDIKAGSDGEGLRLTGSGGGNALEILQDTGGANPDWDVETDSGGVLRFKDNTPYLYVNERLSVGDPSVNPQNEIDVVGNVVIGSSYAGSNLAPSNGLIVEGNVGIGTSSPGFTLDVNEDANISSNLDVGGDTTVSGALDVQDFTFDQSSGDLVLSDSNGVELIRQPKAGATQFVQGAEIGSIEAPEDSLTQVINASSTSAASSGDVVGYTFAVDNQSVLEVKADADGSGGITNKRVNFSSGVEFGGAGDGLVSNNGNLDVRLPISDGATFVTNAYEFVFGTDINIRDDGGNQVTVEHADTGAADSSNTLPTVIRSVSTDGRGHVTSLSTGTFNDGTDINISGNTINHANTGSDQSTGNSGGTFIQSVSTDGRGHVDSVSSNSFSAGDGLNLSGTTFNARIAVQEGGTGVGSGAYLFNFGNQLNVNGDGPNQVSVSVNDGGGSGLDADTVDGYEGNELAALAENETVTGQWTFNEQSGDTTLAIASNNFGTVEQLALKHTNAGDTSSILFDWRGGEYEIGSSGSFTDHGLNYISGRPSLAKHTFWNIDGTVQLFISDNNNVGIGTSSPTGDLHVFDGRIDVGDYVNGNGISIRDSEIYGTQNNTVGAGSRALTLHDDVKVTNELYVNDGAYFTGNNVGIGTTSPDQLLDVEGAADLNGRLNMRGNDIINVNTLNLSNVTSNNSSSHIDWTQPVHFDNTGGNNENYVARFSKNGASKPAILTEDIQIDDFTFGQDSGDLVLSDNNGVELIRQPKAGPTQFIQGAEIGSIEAPTDSFTQVINAPSTSAAASGDLVGYTFAVDNQSVFEVKADADGTGGITNKRIDFSNDVEFGGAGDGLVSNGGNLNVRLPINDGATFVTNAYEFVFGGALDANDDGGNQVTIQHNNTSSQGNVSTGGATVIDDINVDGYGHVTNINTQNRRLSDWLVPTSDLNISDENLDNVGNLNVSSINSNNGSSPVNVTQGFDMNNNFIDNVGRFRTESSNPHPLNIHGGNQTSYFDDSENHIYITQNSHPDTNVWGSMVLQSTNSKGWIMLATSNGSSPETKVRLTDGGNADFDFINGTDLDLNGNSIKNVGSLDVNGTFDEAVTAVENAIGSNSFVTQPDSSGGKASIRFQSNVNPGSDEGFLRWYDNNNTYATGSGGETGVMALEAQNDDPGGGIGDHVALIPTGHIYLDTPYEVRVGDSSNYNVSLNSNGDGYFAGNVGIGTTSPNQKLHVEASWKNQIQFGQGGTSNYASLSSGTVWSGWFTGGSSQTTMMRAEHDGSQVVFPNGNVGIGTNSPSYDLEVSGTSSMNRLNLKNQESAGSDGDVIRDNSVGFIGKWGGNTQAVFWDSNNVSTGSNLTVNGGLGQESQPDISIVNNPQFDGSQIGFGNDPDVLVYEDSNNASGPYWNNEDKLEIRGDGSVSSIELEAGYMHATQAAHVSGPIKVDDEVNFSGSFNVEYNSNSESLDFIYTG